MWAVLKDGTLICSHLPAPAEPGSPDGLELRPPTGTPRTIPISIPSWAGGMPVADLSASADGGRLLFLSDDPNDSRPSFRMATVALSAATSAPFGPPSFWPDAWLPDGRVVATHACADMLGASNADCDPSQRGTYIFSADGTSSTLFFNLSPGAVVVGALGDR